jgi:sulfur-carrier protein adenylyltransferase/sulfurtransferase
MKEITVREFKEMQDNGEEYQLIDVREPYEFDIANLCGELIPQGNIPDNIDKISRDKKVVIHCRSGARSGRIVQYLEQQHGFENLYNLKGGILAWSAEIDPGVPQY